MKAFSSILKLCLGFLILGLILWKTPRGELLLILRETRPSLFLLALGLYLGGQVLSAYKWRLLAEPLGLERPFKDFVAFYFIGMFFNLFMLGSIGGDVYRAALLAGMDRSRFRAAYSVLAERYTGGLALLTFCALFFVLFFREALPPQFEVFLLVALGISWTLLLFLPRVVRALPPLEALARKVKLGDFYIYWEQPRRLAFVLGLSFLFQAINVTTVAILGKALGIEVPYLAYFFIVPVVDLLSALPISLSGLGIREGGYVFMFKVLGVEAVKGFACGLLVLGVALLSGLMGAVVYFWTDYPVDFRMRSRGLEEGGNGQEADRTGRP